MSPKLANAFILFAVALWLLNSFDFVNCGHTPPGTPRGHAAASIGIHPESPREHAQHEKHKSVDDAEASSVKNAKDYVMEAIPPNDENLIKELSTYAVNSCHSIGHVNLWAGPPRTIDIGIAPNIGLLPSPFPENLFRKVQKVQPILNELYYRVTQNHDFLREAYKDLLTEPWIRQQVKLMNAVEHQTRQRKTFLLLRADYLTDQPEEGGPIGIKQVEVNVGQCGGPSYGTFMSKLHEGMLGKVERLHGKKHGGLMEKGTYAKSDTSTKIAKAMIFAWKKFVEEFNDPEARIVYLNGLPLPVNYFDQINTIQLQIEKLASEEGLRLNVVVMPINDIVERLHLDTENDYSLRLDGKYRVALVHMSFGFLSDHWGLPKADTPEYDVAENWTSKAWAKRFDMERSTAIMSPNIRAQLSDTKRVQQILAKPGVIEKLLPNRSKEEIALLRSTFMGLWGFEHDDPETREIIEKAKENPNNFVLKAQKDGGKGNHFDDEMKKMLTEMTGPRRDELKAYTLQEKIRPIAVKVKI